MSPTEAAWLAGLLDGEGCIHASINRWGGIYSRLSITMVHKPTLERALEISGFGRIGRHKKHDRRPTERQAWTWSVNPTGMRSILGEVLPYLVTKHRQAEMYLKMMELHNPKRWTPIAERPNLAERISLMHAIKEDKHVEFRE